MIRFYGVGSDPAWPERTPHRLVLALLRQLPVLEARELVELKAVIAFPHLKQDDQLVYHADLVGRAFPEPAERLPARKRVVEHDPVKAAEYFAAVGVRVKVSGGEKRRKGEGEKRRGGEEEKRGGGN